MPRQNLHPSSSKAKAAKQQQCITRLLNASADFRDETMDARLGLSRKKPTMSRVHFAMRTCMDVGISPEQVAEISEFPKVEVMRARVAG